MFLSQINDVFTTRCIVYEQCLNKPVLIGLLLTSLLRYTCVVLPYDASIVNLLASFIITSAIQIISEEVVTYVYIFCMIRLFRNPNIYHKETDSNLFKYRSYHYNYISVPCLLMLCLMFQDYRGEQFQDIYKKIINA